VPRAVARAEHLDPTAFTPGFCYRRGELCCERVNLESLVSRAGTPLYVYSSASLTSAYRRFDAAFDGIPHSLCYAVKASSNLSILRLFARLGSWFDIVSGGELYRVRRAGVPGGHIVFSGVGKTREEIREALRARILMFNVESEAELELLAEEAAKVGRPAPAGLRVNPDVAAGGHPHIATGHHTHKFGVDQAEALRLYAAYRRSPWIRWDGVSAHIGSQILSVAPFRRAVARMASLAKSLIRAGIPLRYFDFGGGLGVRYTDEQPADLVEYAQAITRAVSPLGCRLLLEPGRALSASAGILLTRVLHTKSNRERRFVIVDAAMNDFLRPAMYAARHPLTAVVRRTGMRRRPVDIAGPVCETGDVFARDFPLEDVQSGDLLALWGAGAYGFVAASNYNSRPRPAEVLVEGNRFRVIRRRETRHDLIRGEL
jgi:diaminopimelate decarboxylase